MQSNEIEWIGGRYALARAEVILWLELPSELLLASTLSDPRTPVTIAKTLEDAMQQPAAGVPRRPSRIRVADEQTAKQLRAAAGGIPIIVAPVPELDSVFSELAAAIGEDDSADIAPPLGPELLEVASRLFRAAPWRRMWDQQTLRVDIPALDIHGACLSIIGAAGESFGLLLFDSIHDYDSFADAEPGRAHPPGRIALRALSFDGENADPVLLCFGADQVPIAVTEKDERIVAMVTRAFLTFFARHRKLFDSDFPKLVRESLEDHGMTVTITAPFAVHEDDRVARATPARRDVGRNDPCPCGSGKKYKKCHLDADQAPRRTVSDLETVHQMDFRLIGAMARFASSRFGPDWLDLDLEEEHEESLELIVPWATWHAVVDGTSVAAAYLEEYARRLSAEERDWIAAQQAAWVSVWEVIAAERGKIDVRDLLTGETRSVREELASEAVVARDTLLARVIDYHGVSYFGGMNVYPLPPAAASGVIAAVRAKLRLRKAAVPVERLRDEKIFWLLADEWANAVDDEDDRRSAAVVLTNTDGDSLQFVTDSFHFDAAMRSEIEQRLLALDDLESEHTEGDEREYVFARASDRTVIGSVSVGRDTLRIETNSQKRADALGDRVREACAGMLRGRKRNLEEPPTLSAGAIAAAAPAEETSLEQQALERELKEEHYRKWLDMPLPALGGKTPRAAARSAKSRAALDLLLRDMENRESRFPEAQRFDIARLRQALRLEK